MPVSKGTATITKIRTHPAATRLPIRIAPKPTPAGTMPKTPEVGHKGRSKFTR